MEPHSPPATSNVSRRTEAWRRACAPREGRRVCLLLEPENKAIIRLLSRTRRLEGAAERGVVWPPGRACLSERMPADGRCVQNSSRHIERGKGRGRPRGTQTVLRPHGGHSLGAGRELPSKGPGYLPGAAGPGAMPSLRCWARVFCSP